MAMKIYTKTGDTGDTGLFGGGRVSKDDLRVEAYGQVDELNAVLGLVRAENVGPMDELLSALQAQLFTVGAILATPANSKASKAIPEIHEGWISAMEQAIDGFDRELAPLTSFILPGGTRAASLLHLARTVCRRAERRVVTLLQADAVGERVVVYLNRMSDLLFTMARAANHRAQVADVPWVSPKHA